MRVKPSMMSTYMLSIVLVATVPVLVVGYLWIGDAQESFDNSVELWRQNYLARRELQLQQNVDQLRRYLDYRRATMEPELRRQLRARIDDALLIADALYQQNKNDLSPTDITYRVAQTLRYFNTHGGESLYQIVTSKGLVLLSQDRPQFEGHNMLELQDSKGRYVAKELLATVRMEGEGFVEGYTYNEQLKMQDERIIFAKYHPELDIIITSREWVSGNKMKIKQEVIERFGGEKQSSLIVFDSAQRAVILPSTMRTFYQATFSNANKPEVVRSAELQRYLLKLSASAEPRFIHYKWDDLKLQKKVPAISYVQAYPEWNWVIGSEVLLNNFYDNLQEEKIHRELLASNSINRIVIAIVLLLFVVILAAFGLYRINVRGLQYFVQYFNKNRLMTEPINTQQLVYKEFVDLGEHVNRMVDATCSYEQELKDSRQKFRLALKASNSFMWNVDIGARELSVSGHFFRLLGYSDADEARLPLSRLLDICHPEDRIQLDKVLLGVGDNSAEVRFKGLDDHCRWFYCRGDVVGEQGFERAGLIIDASQQKALENDLLRAGVLAEEARHVQSQFLSSMSHELHTPLNIILGNVQLLLREDNVPQERATQLKQIETEGFHLLRLINNVLELSKIDSGKISAQQDSIVLPVLLHSVSETMRFKAQDKGLVYKEELDSLLPDVMTSDGVKLKQILLNLVSNAIKYTQRGEVVLSAVLVDDDPSEKYIEFNVSDTGIGIDPAMQEYIFEPFKQLGGANSEGTGLGLSISRRLADSLGAELRLRSDVGKGSCFTLRIPQHQLLKHSEVPSLLSESIKNSADSVVVGELQAGDKSFTMGGLDQEHYQSLCAAAKVGDIETIKMLLNELGSQGLADSLWLNNCKQFLLDFDLDGLLDFLDDHYVKDAVIE